MYLKGDILVDFKRRVLFEYPGREESVSLVLYRCRLATPGETAIFKRDFRGKKQISFAEFKESMPVFDGRRVHGLVYDHLALDEHTYLFFRDMKIKSVYRTGIQDKLSELISTYLSVMQHNNPVSDELDQFRKLKTLLADILKDKK